jgi:hypothetical protein
MSDLFRVLECRDLDNFSGEEAVNFSMARYGGGFSVGRVPINGVIATFPKE